VEELAMQLLFTVLRVMYRTAGNYGIMVTVNIVILGVHCVCHDFWTSL